MGHPERIIPDDTEPGVVALHLKRYVFARPWCEGREVLDVSCGAGYGTGSLAEVADQVVGGDIDEQTVHYARKRYAAPNVRFDVVDAQALPYEVGSFDTFCSFETIEHLDDPSALVREAARVVRGVFIVSTPQVDETTHSPANPFHRIEFSRRDFEALLRERFDEVTLYGQRRRETRRHRVLRQLDVLGLRRRSASLRKLSALTGTPATENAALDDIVIDSRDLAHATELVAVCTNPRR